MAFFSRIGALIIPSYLCGDFCHFFSHLFLSILCFHHHFFLILRVLRIAIVSYVCSGCVRTTDIFLPSCSVRVRTVSFGLCTISRWNIKLVWFYRCNELCGVFILSFLFILNRKIKILSLFSSPRCFHLLPFFFVVVVLFLLPLIIKLHEHQIYQSKS